MSNPPASALPDGYADVPHGRIATIVTTLEMRAAPPRAALSLPAPTGGFSIRPVAKPGLDWYRHIFRHIGEPWLWFSRLRLSDAELASIIHDPRVAIWAVAAERDDGASSDEGLLEIDFREEGSAELAFFGLGTAHTGRGLGRRLMQHAIAEAWSRPIERFWVHTCTLDHPAALGFYVRSGFLPVKRQVEIAPDPRLDGTLSPTAAPQVPLLR